MAFKLVGNKFIDTNAPEYQMYNTIGRDTGATASNSGNIFTKRANSIENALGTTGATLVGSINEERARRKTDQLRKDTHTSMNDIAKKYGYNTWADWQDGYDEAKASGDTARISEMDKQLEEFKAQANTNADTMNKNAEEYKDYVQNDYIGQKTNQDRGKFLGSAINTLSTATDLLGLTNGPISNAIQGGIEGIADELEQNGLQNFDWNRAGQNALVGATTGAVVGGLNKGINSTLAKNGGNLLKGGNMLTRGINNFNQNNGLGRAISTIGTGAARGAVSGAVGGATGAGLSAALNNGDVLGSALQGAGQGLGQGAFAGGVMAGANMAINKTPGVGKFMQKVNQATTNWENSGDNFKERWANTRAEDTWGNRFLDNRVADAQAIKQGFQNVGEGLGVLAERGANRFRSAIEPIMGGNDRLTLAGANGAQPASDTNLMMNETAARRVGDEIQLDGTPMRWNPDQESLTEYRDRLANEIYKNHGAQDNIEVPGRDSKVGINAVSAGKMTSGAGPDVLAKRSELAGDNFDYLRYAEKVGNEPDYKGKHDFANDWDEYLTKNVRFSNGDVADVRNKIANDVNGKGNLYTADYDITKIGSPDKELGSGQSPYPVGASNTSTIPQTEQNVNMPETEVYRALSNDWDKVAKEAGYTDYNDLTQKFAQANPGVEANAGEILDWADNNPGIRQRPIETSKQIKNKRALVEEIESQFRVADKPTVRSTKPNETFYNLYDKMGLSDGDQIRQAVRYAEPGELVPTLIREAAGKAGVVDLTDAQALVSDLKLNKRQNYNKTLAVLEDIIDSTPSTISGGKNGVDALALQRTIEQMASDALGTNGEYHIGNNVVDQVTARNLMRIAGNIGDNLDKVAIANGAVDYALNKYSNEIQQMRNTFPNNEKWQAMVDSEIAGATTIKQLRSAIKDLTRASIFINNGDENFSTASGRYSARNADVPTTRAGMTNKLVNWVFDKVSQTPQARNARLGMYERNINSAKAGETPAPTSPTPNTPATTETPTTSSYNPQTQVYNAIGRVEGEMANDRMRNASTLEDLAAPIENETSVYNFLYGNNGTNYQALELRDAMYRARAAGDNNAATELYNMYQSALGNGTTSTEQVKLTDKQRQANAAARALADFEGVDPNFAYDVSDIPIVGKIANLGGNEYASKAEALALQVGYMLSGATVNKEEAKNIGMAYVPQPRDNEAVRRSKLQQLKGIIADYQQTYAE